MWLGRELGRTVSELRASMTTRELMEQFVFDQRRMAERQRRG